MGVQGQTGFSRPFSLITGRSFQPLVGLMKRCKHLSGPEHVFEALGWRRMSKLREIGGSRNIIGRLGSRF